MARVVIENLVKTFPGPGGQTIRAVNQASLSIADREFLVLVGPSGCGKTTTLRMIAGLDEVTSGTISIDGQVINQVEPKDRDIAMVFQNFALYPHMTVRENMAFGLELRKLACAEIDERLREAAEMLDLNDCLNRKPAELSGGQRQRVAVGRALVRKPKLFLFDEPLSNLDAPMRAQMRRQLSRLHTRLASTMLYVTHDQFEAMSLGDRIAVMRDGAIQQVDEPMNVYHHPANMFVAGFIGSPSMNFFRGTIRQGDGGTFFHEKAGEPGGVESFKVRLEDAACARMTDYANREIVVGIRPENITEQLDPGGAFPVNNVEVLVEGVEATGAETHLYATTGAHSLVARIQPGHSPAVSKKTPLSFDMRRACFFNPETEQAIA